MTFTMTTTLLYLSTNQNDVVSLVCLTAPRKIGYRGNVDAVPTLASLHPESTGDDM